MKIPKKSTGFALQIEPPRCAESISVEEFKTAFANGSGDWRVEQKFDGHRVLFQVRPNGSNENYLTTRHISKATGRFKEKEKLVAFRKYQFPPEWGFCVFDGEVSSGKNSASTSTAIAKGQGTYYCWDVLFFNSEDWRNKPYYIRKAKLTALRERLPSWFHLVPFAPNIRLMLKHAEEQKWEGLILKDMFAPYGKKWVKMKFEDDEDCFIHGYAPPKEGKYQDRGWIGSLRIGQYLPVTMVTGDYHRLPVATYPPITVKGVKHFAIDVGCASGFTEALRKKFSENGKSFLKKVIRVKVQANSREASGKFRHPRFKEFREDGKTNKECLPNIKAEIKP